MIYKFFKNTYSFFKNIMMFLIYYRPTKAMMIYIENYVSIENFVEGVKERWTEESLIEYYQKLEYQNQNLFDYDNKLVYALYDELIDAKYETLLIMIISNNNFRTNDYYKFIQKLEGFDKAKNVLFNKKCFQNNMNSYIEKTKKKINNKLSFNIIINNDSQNNNKLENINECDCTICFESIENKNISECKQCKTKVDLECLSKWLKLNKTKCIMCRQELIYDSEYVTQNLKDYYNLHKYIDYIEIKHN